MNLLRWLFPKPAVVESDEMVSLRKELRCDRTLLAAILAKLDRMDAEHVSDSNGIKRNLAREALEVQSAVEDIEFDIEAIIDGRNHNGHRNVPKFSEQQITRYLKERNDAHKPDVR